MLTQEDIDYLTKKGFKVEPSLPPIKTNSFDELINNPFKYLENDRFFLTTFVKFPDEIRRLTHEKGIFDCFGKSVEQYFVISQQDNHIYSLSFQGEDFTLISTNTDLRNFVLSQHYFLMAMHHIIAGYLQLDFDEQNEEEYYDNLYAFFTKVADNFIEQIKVIDVFAVPEETPAFWWTAYHMMLEAELAFSLPTVSLFTYIDSGRWGKNEEN